MPSARPHVTARRLERAPLAPRRLALAALLLLGLGWSLPAPAQWVWRDSNRQMHSSDLPPPRDIPERDILKRPAARPAPSASAPAAAASRPVAAGSPASAASGGLQAEVEARRAKAEKEEKAKQEAEERSRNEQRAENCRNARREIATFESGQRVVRMNDKGEREFLDDKARAEAMQRAREVAGSDCLAPQ